MGTIDSTNNRVYFRLTNQSRNKLTFNILIRMFFSKPMFAIDHPYLKGKGGRFENNTREAMSGLTMKSLKHRKDLQPLFIIMGLGAVVVVAGFFRCGLMNPENNWMNVKE